mgnify:CR=1 FL=1
MNTIANYIRISDLPYYCKASSSKQVCPQLNCYWSDCHCSFPFILAATGNIATIQTFPFNRREYRRTCEIFHFTRRALPNGGFCGLEFSFEIIEKVTTGEKFALIRDVIRNGRCY